MSQSKHTPGPWHWTDANDHSNLVGADGVIVHSDGSAYGEYSADIDVSGPDARLIAAAPDLLEALEEIVARNEIQHWFNLDQARAAIAKAKGESWTQ